MRFIKKARKTVGTQGEFAERLGVSQAVVSCWESGKTHVPARRIIEIVSMTGGKVTADELLTDHNYKEHITITRN